MRSSTRRRLLVALAATSVMAGPVALSQGRPKRVVHLSIGAGGLDEAKLSDWRRRRRALWGQHGMIEGRDYFETLVPASYGELGGDQALREVVASKPDLIIVDAASAAQVLKRLTSDIPIVFSGISEPLYWGLVQSYRRPGWNLTGTWISSVEWVTKRLALIRELRPEARRVAWVLGADEREVVPAAIHLIQKDIESAAASLGLELVRLHFADKDPIDVDAIVQGVNAARVDAIVPASFRWHPFPAVQERTRIPVVYSPWATTKGLVAGFGPVDGGLADGTLRIATRVLRGESPATIPAEHLTRWHMAVNVKAARALGIEVPQSVLARADEVIR